MKKIVLLTLILAFGVIAGAFANGSSEAEEIADTWDTITVTGTVSFKDWPYPEITSRGTTYELLVPGFRAEELEIESGDQITVEGVVVDRPQADDNYLKVIRAVVDGEEYFVPFGGMGRSGFGGMPGDRYGCWLDSEPYGREPYGGGRRGGRF